MTKHRSHSVAFKRQVAEEFIAGETLHGPSKRHDISRQLIRNPDLGRQVRGRSPG
jgi:transposase